MAMSLLRKSKSMTATSVAFILTFASSRDACNWSRHFLDLFSAFVVLALNSFNTISLLHEFFDSIPKSVSCALNESDVALSSAHCCSLRLWKAWSSSWTRPMSELTSSNCLKRSLWVSSSFLWSADNCSTAGCKEATLRSVWTRPSRSFETLERLSFNERCKPSMAVSADWSRSSLPPRRLWISLMSWSSVAAASLALRAFSWFASTRAANWSVSTRKPLIKDSYLSVMALLSSILFIIALMSTWS
mmetsp:Transcript_86520/g.242276  ORF Transcript_86520/g.242276 Transcript_86520/m.242276 type:complete len:246 (+) Transcript_86520:747-1484(+)